MRIASLTKNLLIKSSNHMDLMTAIGDMSVRALKNLNIEAEKVRFVVKSHSLQNYGFNIDFFCRLVWVVLVFLCQN